MTGDQLREESGDRRDPFHIADKDKKADECQEQKVVDPDKQRAVLYENSGQDDEKHDRPGIDPNDAAQTALRASTRSVCPPDNTFGAKKNSCLLFFKRQKRNFCGTTLIAVKKQPLDPVVFQI